MGFCLFNCKATYWSVMWTTRSLISKDGLAWDGGKACQRKNVAFFYSIIICMKISYYTVKIFGCELNLLLCCFRLSCSLSVEGGTNLFIYITRVKTRNLRCKLLSVSTGKVRHTERVIYSLDFFVCLFMPCLN